MTENIIGKIALALFNHPQNKYWCLKLSELYEIVEATLIENGTLPRST